MKGLNPLIFFRPPTCQLENPAVPSRVLKTTYQTGDYVRITAGPHEGFVGMVVTVAKFESGTSYLVAKGPESVWEVAGNMEIEPRKGLIG